MKTRKIVSLNTTSVIDLSYGDCGKGAVSNILAAYKPYAVIRTSGGSNAGHTIFFNGKKIITHSVPCGLFHGVYSVIGNGCVLNVNKFLEEVEYLKKCGFDTSLIKIARNTHIVTEEHIQQDIESENGSNKIGTTKQGIGPCYRDKYARKGILAEDIEVLKPYIIDMFDFLHYRDQAYKENSHSIIVEGAQGHWLDVDYGHYPYVTSSHPTIAGVLANYIPPKSILQTWGVIKPYDTYVGEMKFTPDSDDENEQKFMNDLVNLGKEFGTTTGRRRQVNYLNLDNIIQAAILNSCNRIVINKKDVFIEANAINNNNHFKLIYSGKIMKFKDFKSWISFVKETIRSYLIFSGVPEVGFFTRNAPDAPMEQV